MKNKNRQTDKHKKKNATHLLPCVFAGVARKDPHDAVVAGGGELGAGVGVWWWCCHVYGFVVWERRYIY